MTTSNIYYEHDENFAPEQFDRNKALEAIQTILSNEISQQAPTTQTATLISQYLDQSSDNRIESATFGELHKIAKAIGAAGWNNLYSMARKIKETNAFAPEQFDRKKALEAIQTIIVSNGLKQKEVAETADVSLSYLNQIFNGKAATVSPAILQKIAKAIGAQGWDDLYEQAEKIKDPNGFAPEQFDRNKALEAIQTIIVSNGLSQKEVAEAADVSIPYLNQIFNGKAAAVSPAILQKIAEAIGVQGWNHLYEQAETLKNGNSFSKDSFDAAKVCDALRIIKKTRKITLHELSNLSGVSVPYIQSIVSEEANPSANILLKVARSLGAISWKQLYRMAGMESDGPDNGIGSLVGGLVNQVNAAPARGTVGEMLNTPIKQLLAPSVSSGGRIDDTKDLSPKM